MVGSGNRELPWSCRAATMTHIVCHTTLSPQFLRSPKTTLGPRFVPPPPVSRNHLAQEPTPGSAVEFSHHFSRVVFFMFLVDVGQLFRCAGHHFMCVTTGPPIRGDPISHPQVHIPLKPLPPASKATAAPKPGPKG